MANNIKILRTMHNMSQERLSKKLNVSQGTLSSWERGEHDIDNESLKALASLFNVSTDYVLGISEVSINGLPLIEQKESAPVSDKDAELMEYLEYLKERPERKALLSVTKNASKEQIEAAVKIVDTYLESIGVYTKEDDTGEA